MTKRWILQTAVIVAMLAFPMEGIDVGQIQPVALLQIEQKEGNVYLSTDLEHEGIGETFEAAYQDMKDKATGEVFLDTADFLIIKGEMDVPVEQLQKYIRKGIRVCQTWHQLDLKRATAYLTVHKPEIKLRTWDGRKELQKLECQNREIKLI